MNQSTYLQKLNCNGNLGTKQFWKITYLKRILHLHSSTAVHKTCPRDHRCSGGTCGHGEPDGVPHWSNVLRSPSCFFFLIFFRVVSFVWLLKNETFYPSETWETEFFWWLNVEVTFCLNFARTLFYDFNSKYKVTQNFSLYRYISFLWRSEIVMV